MRCTVREMWASNCDIVSSGYISEKTRFSFRSLSAMCTIYIQMSREMWEFDVNGEMYHEKAVNFLTELFTNWKNQTCQHDVTIALFSRIFYEANSIEEFPNSICAGIKKDHKGRFYEDFYRVVYQNERYEDWTPTLVLIKRLIKEYRNYVLNYHKNLLATSDVYSGQEVNMPSAGLSSAAEGNFLETLNLSSSVFERHFIDRPFDRSGMMSLVITAGNGVFEVSRELTKITKERVIDNGIGSDLLCLGEQPLHSVPLFKYEDKNTYGIPHWINLR
jgi:DEP domain-containing protein 5